MAEIHSKPLEHVPGAKASRDDVSSQVYGMSGIPLAYDGYHPEREQASQDVGIGSDGG
ncbi:uncharacterized protein AMSG_01235 [Thecamonas trahens ATCC 50062]|uniref:Uncharacterized protein n=1 Tax=Thecamonas trahens ATCC 50062 TaxID=461836 RepID=A0A0L0DMI0_THETB|nr:hypothetical protein AMSG_01235 [Thecamonas trahens ATCC 50062]KNC53522.1 hypothetical protein AMSG_01235 [Thecamonas trahens ATCC 50062]|eukprot:XP_013761843.1 hypothetical protein AMSG_01235 [Thecamonas trahens ATCC 50062]